MSQNIENRVTALIDKFLEKFKKERMATLKDLSTTFTLGPCVDRLFSIGFNTLPIEKKVKLKHC